MTRGLEWIAGLKPGDEVVEWRDTYTRLDYARISRVERITQTLVVLDSGVRISKRSGVCRGSTFDTHISGVDDEVGQEKLDEHRLYHRIEKARAALHQLATLLRGRDHKLLDRVEAFLNQKEHT